LPEILRNAFASLALALGFAGLAQRPGRDLSLLAELQLRWQRLAKAGLRIERSRGSGPRSADPDDFQRLTEQAEAEDAQHRGNF
jgi:hypothetical protein